jgi:hypothetical protein
MPDDVWEQDYYLFRKPLIDGTSAWGPLMRRKVMGKWQYRKCTEEEEQDYVSREGW